jgi:hypothetical protein
MVEPSGMTMLSVRPSLGENTLRRLVLTNAKSAKSTAFGGEGLVMGQSGDLIGQVVINLRRECR